MYAELFDQLGRSRNAAANATVETPPIVAFKAGVMTLTGNGDKYHCTADPATRGQVRLIRNPTNADEIKWQLYDRRRDTVIDTDIIPPGSTFTKVEPPQQRHTNNSAGGGGGPAGNNKDRIYVWTRPASTPIYKMYWLQDADDTDDDDICKTVNETLKSAKAISTTTSSTSVAMGGGRSSGSRSTGGGTANSGGATNADPQVDTLSSILENLGMPAPAAGPAPNGAVGGAAATTTTTTNQLTLADLQGAMASIQQQQVERQAQLVDLTDIITTEAITDLIEHDAAAVQRLLPFLPETQQSMEHLRDNLLSPSVRRSLALLSQALADGGESYGSVIANFQLDAQAGQDALVQGNPIAAFLDCITASVAVEAATAVDAGEEEEKDAAAPDEAKEKEDEEMKEEESKEDAADLEES